MRAENSAKLSAKRKRAAQSGIRREDRLAATANFCKSRPVIINDDDNWEPDEDFWVQLYEPSDPSSVPIENAVPLIGADTKTIVTIIDDDKPGSLAFEDSKPIKAVASSGVAEVNIIRKNGSDGIVKVDWETI